MPARKVLVIDDEQSIITYLKTVLEDFGYEPLGAIDADEGEALARKEQPDLICIDIMMPKRSGIALYQHFRLDPELSHIPVIIISAFNQVLDLRDPVAFRKVVPDPKVPKPEYCMEKPIDIMSFIDVVNSLTGTADSEGGQERGTD